MRVCTVSNEEKHIRSTTRLEIENVCRILESHQLDETTNKHDKTEACACPVCQKKGEISALFVVRRIEESAVWFCDLTNPGSG
jgi:hypothetical protein